MSRAASEAPKSFSIAGRLVGESRPCLIIGEVAQAHDGSLGQAHAFIEAIAKAGADAVKFQTHIAAAESTPAEPWRVAFSRQDASRYDYWRRMEFTQEQWAGLKQHAESLNLLFFSSPFSVEAVELLQAIGMAAWKIASGEVTNPLLIKRVLATRLPVLLSTGMSGLSEIDAAVAAIARAGAPYAVMHCTSMYPTPPEKVGLNMIAQLRQRYGCPVGLSDHSGTIFPALAAAASGLELLEVHVAFSREQFGPDVTSSVTMAELAQLVQGVRYIETMRNHPVSKDAVCEELKPLRAIFTRSLVARTDLKAGTILQAEHLTAKKPGTGIAASRYEEVIGKRLGCDVRADSLLKEQDLE